MDHSLDQLEAVRSLRPHQARDGFCGARQQVRCALDVYLPLVVDVNEEPAGAVFDKISIPTLTAGPAAYPGQQVRL